MGGSLAATFAGVPLAFLWTAFVIELTPGPNMSYLAVLSLADGRRAGFAAVAGVAVGLAIVGMIAALGLAALIAESPALYQILRWTGVLYLFWLAYGIWRGDERDALNGRAITDGLTQYFVRGLITNLLNPKAAIFYVAILPPFLDPARDILRQTLSMSLAYVAIATVIHLTIVVAASTARNNLEKRTSIVKLRAALAVSVLIIAVWLVWSTRPGV